MLLDVQGLTVAYGKVRAVRDLALEVAGGEIVALLGPNGAGKTSTLRAIMGLTPKVGEVRFAGKDIGRLKPESIVRRGLTLSPEGRRIFSTLTVDENLRLGAIAVKDRAWVEATQDELLERFPVLGQRLHQPAGTLSGGEQQQLALARALLSKPRMILLDEPSLGLAPKFVTAIFSMIAELPSRGIAVLLVEQNVHYALRVADKAYVLAHGELVRSGPTDELLKDEQEIEDAYLGLVAAS